MVRQSKYVPVQLLWELRCWSAPMHLAKEKWALWDDVPSDITHQWLGSGNGPGRGPWQPQQPWGIWKREWRCGQCSAPAPELSGQQRRWWACSLGSHTWGEEEELMSRGLLGRSNIRVSIPVVERLQHAHYHRAWALNDWPSPGTTIHVALPGLSRGSAYWGIATFSKITWVFVKINQWFTNV